MRVAVFSDVHGNLVALNAVLIAAHTAGVTEFWIIGDLVAHGPQPAQTLQRIRSLKGLRAVRGNTDRYVLTGDLAGMIPSLEAPTSAEETVMLVAATSAHAWTRGCITATGGYRWLEELPVEQRFTLPDGTRTLLVHAAPGRDDGPGLTVDTTEDELASTGWYDMNADLVFVGHTHRPLRRRIGTAEVVNLGSVSIPATADRGAMWTLLEADETGYTIDMRIASYDLDAVFEALDDARHPSADWLKKKFEAP